MKNPREHDIFLFGGDDNHQTTVGDNAVMTIVLAEELTAEAVKIKRSVAFDANTQCPSPQSYFFRTFVSSAGAMPTTALCRQQPVLYH